MNELSPMERSAIVRLHRDPDAMTHLGNGSQNRVWQYEGPQGLQRVLKIQHIFISSTIRTKIWSNICWSVGGQSLKGAQKDLELVGDYFEPELVDTSINISDDKKIFGFEQDKIDYLIITPELVRTNASVRKQLKNMMTRNGKMIEHEGRWLDFMGCDPDRFLAFIGLEGTPYFDNIVLDKKTERIKIIDLATYGFNPLHLPLYCIQHENAQRFGLPFRGSKKQYRLVNSCTLQKS